MKELILLILVFILPVILSAYEYKDKKYSMQPIDKEVHTKILCFSAQDKLQFSKDEKQYRSYSYDAIGKKRVNDSINEYTELVSTFCKK